MKRFALNAITARFMYSSVMMALWALTTAFGNVFVAAIAESAFFSSLAVEFLFYAALMIVFLVLFIFLVRDYEYRVKPVDVNSISDDDEFYFGQKG
jgi:dipeptide/tripeptide permease